MFWKCLILFYAVYLPSKSYGHKNHPHCFPAKFMNSDDTEDNTPNRSSSKTTGVTESSWLIDKEIMDAINKQIRIELGAHYAYLSMSYHFDQAAHHLPGFSKFFKKMSEEEHEHAQKFMKYINKRGGKIHLHGILEPCNDGNWGNGTVAMQSALDMEKYVYATLMKLHKIGGGDPQFVDFLESEFLAEQIDSIKEINNYVNVLEKLNNHLGEYQFDKLTLGGDKEG